MVPKLSEGSLNEIVAGVQISKPVVQILGYKKIPGGNNKYRLLISDGVACHPYVMLGTQLNDKLLSGEFEKFTVVRLDKYVVNQVHPEKRVMMLLEMTVLASGADVGEKLGNPTQTSVTGTGTTGSSNTDNYNSNDTNSRRPFAAETPPAQPTNNRDEKPAMRPYSNAQPVMGGRANMFGGNAQDSAPLNIHPISSLTPYQNRWTIRARVSNKSNIRTWSNSRGEGKLFSVDLLDESGEIRGTAFNEQCDKFYEMIEVNKVYYISKCTLKTANKRFTSIKNDYEMTFNSETTVIPCNDDVQNIPTLQFDFVPIFELQNVEKDCLVDVIGVCKSTGDVQHLVSRTTNKELKKRDIHLVDKTNVEVTLTLWDVEAEKFDGSTNPIVAIKGARVSDFAGRSLTMASSATLQINPDIREAHSLRGWYDREGANAETQSISTKSFGGSIGGNSVWKTFAQAKVEMLGSGEKGDYYTSKASVVMIRKENCMYMACPSKECNKKVVDMNNGRYRCEKCNQEYDSFKWRLLLLANICDFSDNQWVTCFEESAEAILGVKAEELGRLKESGEETKFDEVLANANFKSYIFRLRTKVEVYNEEARLKTSVTSATPVNYKEYGHKLVSDIKLMEPHL